VCIHEIKGNLYNYKHFRDGGNVHSIYLGPVSGERPWIKEDFGEISKGYGYGTKHIHEPSLIVDKATLQQLKEADVKNRNRLVKEISKIKEIKIPGNNVTTYFNGAGEITGQTFKDEEGKTWKLPTVAPQKARETIYSKNSMKHPAKMNPIWAQAMIQKYSEPGDTILDPMGGIGTTGIEASRLGRNAIIIDFEKRWINQAMKNVELLKKSGQKIGDIEFHQGDARDIKIRKKVDVIMFSPPYGHAAMGGQKYDDKKTEEYSSYSKNLDNIGMKTGNKYFEDITKVYVGCHKTLKNNGIMVVNTKNRVEQGKEVRFDIQTRKLIEENGFKFIEQKRVHAPPSFFRIIYEEKYPEAPKIHHEDFMIFEKLN